MMQLSSAHRSVVHALYRVYTYMYMYVGLRVLQLSRGEAAHVPNNNFSHKYKRGQIKACDWM